MTRTLQLAYAEAISEFADTGGYDLEVVWNACTTLALGLPYETVRDRRAGTLSGGEQKRLMLEALLRGPDEVLLLDEPDNYLDIPGKEWLEERLRATAKTVLAVTHDRWFAEDFDSYLVFDPDGAVRQCPTPMWQCGDRARE